MYGRPREDKGWLAADSRIGLSRHSPHDVLEELVTETGRVVQAVRRRYLRRDDQLPGANERLESDRIVLEGPGKAHSIRELGEPVPPQRADPRSAEGLDQTPQIQICREIGLEDCDARLLRRKPPGTQDLHRSRGHAIPEIRVLDEVVVRQPV